jgi:DNA-binding response OmpR family regulator
MNHLRKKLGEQADQPRLLRNEPGIGYRLMC